MQRGNRGPEFAPHVQGDHSSSELRRVLPVQSLPIAFGQPLLALYPIYTVDFRNPDEV